MGRTPEGEQAVTGAERQARYRERINLAHGLAEAPDANQPPAAPRKPPRGPSLSRRWDDTVARLAGLQAEYARWLAALPEATRDTATGEALQAIVDLDLEDIMAIRPPLGFGRDQAGPSAMTFRQGRMTRFQRGRSVPGHAPGQNKNEADRS
jgi:hypothetical protein